MDGKRPYVIVSTDGGASPNPGLGGWAALLKSQETGKILEISGAEEMTTNNRMELRAVVEALSRLKVPCRVLLRVDSAYVMNGFTQGWIERWMKNGWTTGDGKEVANRELWERLIELNARHELSWVKVRSHSLDPANERCDLLVRQARERFAAQKIEMERSL